jgi:hypothetical protein
LNPIRINAVRLRNQNPAGQPCAWAGRDGDRDLDRGEAESAEILVGGDEALSLRRARFALA